MRTFLEFVAEKLRQPPAQRPVFKMRKNDDFWRRALNKAIAPAKTTGINVSR